MLKRRIGCIVIVVYGCEPLNHPNRALMTRPVPTIQVKIIFSLFSHVLKDLLRGPVKRSFRIAKTRKSLLTTPHIQSTRMYENTFYGNTQPIPRHTRVSRTIYRPEPRPYSSLWPARRLCRRRHPRSAVGPQIPSSLTKSAVTVAAPAVLDHTTSADDCGNTYIASKTSMTMLNRRI